MSRRKRIATAAATAVGMVFVGPQSTSAVTTLTGLDTTNNPVPVDHGSRAPGTPNIELEWSVTGAGRWDQFRNITLPLLSPTTYFLSILGVIGTFKAFNTIFVMRTRSCITLFLREDTDETIY